MAESDTVATSAIAVHRGVWDSFCPNLPADVAAMVAPPVTVSSFPVTGFPVTGFTVTELASAAEMRVGTHRGVRAAVIPAR